MNDNKKVLPPISVGYVSVMMIFAVICLTILAVLSFQAAGSGNSLTQKNAAFTEEYYNADSTAKEKLAVLDTAAAEALESGFFEDTFPALANEQGFECVPTAGGFKVCFTEAVNDRLVLNAEIMFFSNPQKNRYKILKWSTGSADNNNGENSPSLWDGEF